MIRSIRWELWVFWRRLTRRCLHTSQGIVSVGPTTCGAQCGQCGEVTQTFPKPLWMREEEARTKAERRGPNAIRRNAFVSKSTPRR